MMNRTIVHKKRMRKIIDRIRRSPESWHQQQFHCGTKHCIAGHAQIDLFNSKRKQRSGKMLRWWNKKLGHTLTLHESKRYTLPHECYAGFCKIPTTQDAQKWLGLSDQEARWLFNSHRTWADIVTFYRLNREPFWTDVRNVKASKDVLLRGVPA